VHVVDEASGHGIESKRRAEGEGDRRMSRVLRTASAKTDQRETWLFIAEGKRTRPRRIPVTDIARCPVLAPREVE
jgi:hypothetical protein